MADDLKNKMEPEISEAAEVIKEDAAVVKAAKEVKEKKAEAAATKEAAKEAEAAAKALFTGGPAGGDIPTLILSMEDLAADARISTMLVRSGLCKSQSDARKQIEQNAVSVNDQKITDPAASLSLDQFGTDGILLKKGKKGF